MARANMEGSANRISSLPDSILGHILSFLPTNVAVSTCILLTRSRWRDIFPFSNTLNFDQSLGNYPNDTRLFMDFVDRFIMLMNGTSIDKFRLKCSDDVDTSCVNSWIAPLLCNVRELDLCIGTRRLRKEYSSLFNLGSNTLVVLRLEGAGFSFNVLASVCFPCLKTLHLQSIRIAKKDSPIQKLVSNCPVLEDLLIAGCYVEDVPVLSLSSTSLKRLTIREPYGPHPYKLVLDTPSLAYLKFHVWERGHTLKSIRSLREGHICVSLEHTSEAFNNVQSLYLSGNVREVTFSSHFFDSKFIQKALDLLEELPLLKNLTRLVVTDRPYLEMSGLMKLLQCFPNIEELVTDGIIHGGYDVPRFLPSRLKSIECALFYCRGVPDHKENSVPSRLKFIECALVFGRDLPDQWNEVKSLEYFLKNANMLEKMQIHIWYHWEVPRRSKKCESGDKLLKTVMKTLKKLVKVPRRSKTCEMNVFFHSITLKVEDQVYFSEFCDFNSIKITFV